MPKSISRISNRANSNDSFCYSSISIYDLAFPCRIGVTEGERLTPQEIRLDATISYPSLPKGASTDDYNDVICYDKLCKLIISTASAQEFNLIEHLAQRIFDQLLLQIGDSSLSVKIRKRPKIAGLQGYIECKIEKSYIAEPV